MKKPRLDDIDLRIIDELQRHGRMTNVDLARRVGISAPPCLRRVRALEQAGFIAGYHANVDPALLGFGVTVFAMVGLHSQAEADLQSFEARVESWPEVRECHMLNGDIDFILKCVAPDLASFQEFLTQKLTPATNVANVKTSLTIRQSKNCPACRLIWSNKFNVKNFVGFAAARCVHLHAVADLFADQRARNR